MSSIHRHKIIEFIDNSGGTLESTDPSKKVWASSASFLKYCRSDNSTLGEIGQGVQDVLSGKRKIFQSEYRIRQGSSDERCLTVLALPSTDGGAMLIHEDITDMRLLENEPLGISEIEQHRMSKVMHDGICQVLSGMTLSIAVLTDSLKEKGAPESTEMEYLLSIAQNAAHDTRELYQRICPMDQSGTALVIALQHLNRRISKSNSCSFICPVDISIINRNISLLLYRIAQEVCHEAEWISHAQNITLRLVKKLEHIVLDIEDDGRGFDGYSEQFSEQLKLLHYRISLLEGIMRVRRDSVRSNRVRCIVPLVLSYDF